MAIFKFFEMSAVHHLDFAEIWPFFDFLKWRPSAILNLFYASLDHPCRAMNIKFSIVVCGVVCKTTAVNYQRSSICTRVRSLRPPTTITRHDTRRRSIAVGFYKISLALKPESVGSIMQSTLRCDVMSVAISTLYRRVSNRRRDTEPLHIQHYTRESRRTNWR